MVSSRWARKSPIARSGLVVALSVVLVLAFVGSAFAASVNVRVEGATHTIFAGSAPLGTRSVQDSGGAWHAETSNALSVLDGAAERGAFPFVLDNMAFGLFVSSIAGEEAVLTPPYPGWSYRVNGVSPSVGADQHPVKAGDNVLWFYGTWDASPTAVTVPATYVAVNTTATVVARQLDPAGVSSALGAASVNIGRYTATSGADGKATLRLSAPGDYAVRVSKDGYIRSAVKTLKVRYTTKLSSLRASATTVRKGRTTTLSGTLTGVGRTPARRRVNLYARKSGSSKWTLVAYKTASSTGAFSFSVKPTKSAYYRASFAGDSEFAPATSYARAIYVR